MALTEDKFNGNGSNLGPFTFTFSWLESGDIKVSVDGIDKTAGTHYNLQNLNYATRSGGQVLFTAGNAPTAGTNNIRVYRETGDTALTATFNSGSSIRAQDLNENFLQSLYVAQETKTITVNASSGDLAAGSVTSEKIANGAVTPTKLAETYLTTAAASSTYQTQAGMSAYLTTANAATTYAPISSFTTTSVNKTLANRERCSVLASGLTITLPSSPQAGWEVSITVVGAITNTVVARNGQNIMSLAEDMTIDKGDLTVTLLFVDATRGWRII